MPFATVSGAGAPPIDLYYQDIGSGKPVVLIHGWPASHAMWEHQSLALAEAGCRVIAYDRRGFGQSSKPWSGYNYDQFADDLKAVLDALDVNDATLVGFSMGGGEVARYMSRHGGARVGRVALVSAVTPYLLKDGSNPHGVDKSVFDDMITKIRDDRPAFLEAFFKQFFGVGLVSHPVSAATLEFCQSLAWPASPKATLDCVRAFSATDFRGDLTKITVPTLIIHGSDDKVVPIDVSGKLAAKLMSGAKLKIYDGAPHGLFVTHKDSLSADLIALATSA